MNGQNCVRSGIRTHAHIRGPENSLMRHEKGINLESGALDHSAILTYDQKRKIIESFILQRKNMSNWFEKSSSVWLSCLLTECLKSRSRESRQLVWICPDLAPVGITGAVAQVVERSLSMWEVRGSIPRSSNEFLSELCPIVAAAWTKWDTPSHLRKDIFLLATHYSNSQKRPKRLVRSGIRTHAHRSGLRPERSALDRSAILTRRREKTLPRSFTL